MSVPPHTRHKHIQQRLRIPYSHLSLPTDHTTTSYRLAPWPGHTVLSDASRHPPPPPRRPDPGCVAGGPDPGCVAGGAEIRVLGSIDREEGYEYTPRVQLEENARVKLSLDSRLLRSYDAGTRLLRPLHHVSGARPLTPPPGPLSVRPSRVLLDAHALVDKSREVQREREKKFLRRIRHNSPLFLPDLSRDKAPGPEGALVAFSATCLGQSMRKPLTTLSSLQQALDESRQKLKISSRINIPRPVGTLETEFKHRNAPMKRQRLPPDHLLVVSSPFAPPSPGDIVSLCTLREGLWTLKEKGNKRIK